jgi:hypothetical protein
VLQAKKHTPPPYPFIVFTFGLAIESIKELRGASQALNEVSETTYMDNPLEEFKELHLDNALFEVQNQTLVIKNLKWKEWWQTIQDIT